MTEKLSLDFWWRFPKAKRRIIQNVIIDRGSKYTVIAWEVKNRVEVNTFMWEILKDKYFKNASHNSYAFRIKHDNWAIEEWKNDDGEEGAWMCILRELQRENMQNTIVVVTRIFWWTLLYADRFKNVINATKKILDEI